MIWREQSEDKVAVLTAGYESGGGLGTGTAGRAQGAEKSCLRVRRKQQAGVESLRAMTVETDFCAQSVLALQQFQHNLDYFESSEWH